MDVALAIALIGAGSALLMAGLLPLRELRKEPVAILPILIFGISGLISLLGGLRLFSYAS